MQQSPRSLIPAGMATVLPAAAQRVRQIESTLLQELLCWGYQEIILPSFEYLDVLSAGLEPHVLEKCYKFVDRDAGRMLVLRPDVTAQIARIVAMGMLGSTLPIRVCYRTTVFRDEPHHAGREREIFQVGAELIGKDSISIDAEIIIMMIQSLKRLGLQSFQVSLGHVGFLKALLEESGMSAQGRSVVEEAASGKDLPRLETVLKQERVPAKIARVLREVPNLYGRDEVLARGRVLAGRNAGARVALDRLEGLYQLLKAADLHSYVLLDLGEFRGFDYYDGVVFDVFAEGLGFELGGGGRYNHLIGKFGRNLPSTGFAFDVGRLFQVLEQTQQHLQGRPPDCLLLAVEARTKQLFSTAWALRQVGLTVIQETFTTADRDVWRLAEEKHRYHGARAVAVFPDGTKDRAYVQRIRGNAPSGKAPTSRGVKSAFTAVPCQDLVGLLCAT